MRARRHHVAAALYHPLDDENRSPALVVADQAALPAAVASLRVRRPRQHIRHDPSDLHQGYITDETSGQGGWPLFATICSELLGDFGAGNRIRTGDPQLGK